MKSILLALAVSLASSMAFAEDSLFVRYEKLANVVAARVTTDDAQQDIAKIASRNMRLQKMGAEIMDLYGVKFPECAEQYEDFNTKISIRRFHRCPR